MKPLTLEERRLKEEMKQRCLIKGQYTDKNAKNIFKMLCHLEDFEIQYWELLAENKQLKERINYLERSNNRREDVILEQKQEINDLEDNWNELRQIICNKHKNPLGGRELCCYADILDKMQKLEQGSDSNE